MCALRWEALRAIFTIHYNCCEGAKSAQEGVPNPAKVVKTVVISNYRHETVSARCHRSAIDGALYLQAGDTY